MTTVTETNTYTTTGTSQQASTGSTDELGQEEFLMLMTTQLMNQDPLKPMESGDFLGQLAQFGTVSGIDELQQAFTEFAGTMVSSQTLQASSLLDREVLVKSNEGYLPAVGQLKGAVDVPAGTSQLVVGIYDSAGQLVRRMDLGAQEAGQAEFAWDGKAEDGSTMSAGTYEVRAEALFGGQNQALQTLVSGTVESVTVDQYGGGLTLDVSGLGTVSFSSVQQIS